MGHGLGAAMALQAETPRKSPALRCNAPNRPAALAEARRERDAAVTARELP